MPLFLLDRSKFGDTNVRRENSIIIYDILDNEIIYILDNIPANLKIGVVYESNDIRYKLDNDRSILLNREDLIATDVYRGAR